jgi:hypothetical protein
MALVQVKTNNQIDEEKAKADAAKESKPQINLTSLAGYVQSCWVTARDAKRTIKDEMEAVLRQRNGEYSDTKLREIATYGGSDAFMRLTDEKCTACKAWLTEIMVQDKPWSISPTPIPELPNEVVEEIEQQVVQELQVGIESGIISPEDMDTRRHELMLEVQNKSDKLARKSEKEVEKKIHDILVDANWDIAFKAVLDDVVDLHVGILKGPILRKRKELNWGKEGKPVVSTQTVIEFARVSPFDIYPSPTSTDINDGFILEKHRLTRSALVAMKGIPGYDVNAIDRVLERATFGGLYGWLDDSSTTPGLSEEKEKDDINFGQTIDHTIEALQFWGKIQGKMLQEWDAKVENKYDEYETEVWYIAGEVIKAEINGDPLGRRPYFKASFRERNGSFWGAGLPETISDIQDVCNAAVRNLVNNMAFASGPQVGVDVSRLAEGESPTGIAPNKIWQFDESMNVSSGGRPPIWFFQPKALVGEILRVYEFFSNEADNKSGVPKYSYGSGGSAGALGTATGMSMMMSNASRGIKQVVSNIDYGIIQPAIHRLYEWFMLYDSQSGLPGDIKIVAKGSSALLAKEQQQVRRNEFLNIALQPPVMEIIGRDGLATILRSISEGLDFGSEEVVPTESQLRLQEFMQQQQMQQMMMQQQAMGGQPQQQAPQPKGPETTPDGSVAGGADINAFRQGG